MKFCFCLWWSFFLIFLFSLSILSLSLGYFDNRSSLISLYSSQQASWKSSNRSDFESLSISIDDGINLLTLIEQDQDSLLQTRDLYASIPSNYTPLIYTISSHISKIYNKTDTLSLNLTVSDADHKKSFELPPLQIFKSSHRRLLRSGCKSLGGVYQSFGNCRLDWVKDI